MHSSCVGDSRPIENEVPADDQPGSSRDQPRSAARGRQQRSEAQHPFEDVPATVNFERPEYHFSKKKNIPSKGLPIFPDGNFTPYKDFSPRDLMELFWTDELLEYMCAQISKYCVFKGVACIQPTVRELRVFLGILLVSGYCPFPQRWMFWSHQEDLGNQSVSHAMRKVRFDQYMTYVHFADNTTLQVNDRYYKLRPLISYLQKKFMQHFVPVQNISHDEAVVEYFGRNSMKQHIIEKPLRFGYKVWCLNTPLGYLIAFIPYQGKCGQYDEQIAKVFGKSSGTVVSLMNQLSDEIRCLPFHVLFDNLFSSLDLLVYLKRQGWNATGTVRSNRLPRQCPLKAPDVMRKEERGTMSMVKVEAGDTEIFLVRWKDNNE